MACLTEIVDGMMEIKIRTYDGQLVFDLLGKPSASFGDRIEIADHVSLIYNGTIKRRAIGLLEIVNFTLVFGSGVAASLIAAGLYDKLKGRKVETVIIERTEVEIDEGQIRKVMEERVKFEKEL